MPYNTFSRGPRTGQCKTIRDRIIRFLEDGLNKKQIEKTGKRIRFTGRNADHFYFVGKLGSIRSGKNISNSLSITEQFRANMRIWEAKNGLK